MISKPTEFQQNLEGNMENQCCQRRSIINSAGSMPTIIGGKLVETGLKYDQDKSRVDLLDPEFLEGVGNVLKYGADKYAAHNWRGGIKFSRILGALLRHTFALLRGEDCDPESGLPHIHHVGCCAMFLSWHLTHRPDLDDRFKYGDYKQTPI